MNELANILAVLAQKPKTKWSENYGYGIAGGHGNQLYSKSRE